MAENYKILYEQMKKMVDKYQDDIVPGLRRVIERLEAERQWISVEDIADAPTVDAVEVVRCKDCKYYCQDKINGVICRHPALDFDTECFDHWINTNPDDFCSYGELKEGVG